MRRQLFAAAAAALMGCLPFEDNGVYACDTDTGEDCVTCDSGWCRDITARVLGATYLNAIAAAGPNDIWAVGSNGVIVKWNGKRWAGQATGYAGDFNAVWAARNDEVFVAGNDATWGFYDGADWSVWRQEDPVLTDMLGVGGDPDWYVWMLGLNGEVTVLVTTGGVVDATSYWALYGVVSPADAMWAAWTDSNNYSYFAGNGGRVLQDPDTGASLADAVPLFTGTTNNLLAIGPVPSTNNFWVVGAGGTVLYWNGSAFSLPHDIGSTETLWGVCATGPSDVWVAGTGQTLKHWDGLAWADVAQPFQEDIYNLYCTVNDVWGVTSEGSILRYRR